MFESGYYPPGAEFDPRAPYNQPVNDYASEVDDRIYREIESFDPCFSDWLYECCDDLPEEFIQDDELTKQWLSQLPEEKRNSVYERYNKYRFDPILEELCLQDYDYDE